MLKEILSISGKPGLQKLISNSSNAIIVESLIDGKRFPPIQIQKLLHWKISLFILRLKICL